MPAPTTVGGAFAIPVAMAGRRISRWALGLALLGLLVPGAAGAASRTDSPHVEKRGDGYVIADRSGRQLLLRGINSNALVQYPDYFQQTVPLERSDVREMAALGFNFLRLPINWSLLEPQPGEYSQSYLDTIDRIAGWAGSEGMWVLVDFHQDRYNRNLRPNDEADGSPDWATLTDGQPCEESFFTSPCSRAALDNFWENKAVAGRPLQEHYLEAMRTVSRELRDRKRLLGLELMNEPTPGTTFSPDFEREQLWPFENRMIEGLRADGEKRMIWFGPNVLRDTTDADPGKPTEPFSDDGNLVYAPHVYTGVFNDGDLDDLRASYEAAEQEADAYAAPWVDAEWGGGTDPAGEERVEAKMDLQDEYLAGSGFWMWKQKPGFYNWHTVEPDGSLRPDSMRAQMLSRPHLDAVPGTIVSTAWDDGRLVSKVRGKGGRVRAWSGTVVDAGGETLIASPNTRVQIDGKSVKARLAEKRFSNGTVDLGGFRLSFKLPKGKHTVELLPAAADG